jgi:hypothetical protein
LLVDPGFAQPFHVRIDVDGVCLLAIHAVGVVEKAKALKFLARKIAKLAATRHAGVRLQDTGGKSWPDRSTDTQRTFSSLSRWSKNTARISLAPISTVIASSSLEQQAIGLICSFNSFCRRDATECKPATPATSSVPGVQRQLNQLAV